MNQYKLIFLSLISLLISCQLKNQTNTTSATQPANNLTVTTSSDIAKLEKIINLNKYRPTKVQFNYTFIDNSAKSRIDIPGPSDSYLEALLYFDKETMALIYEFDRSSTPMKTTFSKQQFNFEWLPTEIRKELENSSANYNGHHDYFFGKSIGGRCWYLEDKILLYLGSGC